MKIGVIGAQGVGKSTLISELVKTEAFCDFTNPPSPTRYLSKEYGFDFSTANTEIQLATLYMQQKNTHATHNVILDRSVIDNFAYIIYHIRHNTYSFSPLTYEFILRESIGLAEQLDYVFYLQPEFPLVADGVRNTDRRQQKEINESIQQALQILQVPNAKVHKISGSVQERVDKIINIVYP